jgi:hypothetical protein
VVRFGVAALEAKMAEWDITGTPENFVALVRDVCGVELIIE